MPEEETERSSARCTSASAPGTQQIRKGHRRSNDDHYGKIPDVAARTGSDEAPRDHRFSSSLLRALPNRGSQSQVGRWQNQPAAAKHQAQAA